MINKKNKKIKNKKYSKYLKTNDDKSNLRLFFERLLNMLSHRIYFILIPYSKKKSKSISLPVYTLVAVLLIVSSIFFISFTLLTKSIVLDSRTRILEGSYEERFKMMKSFENDSRLIAENNEYRDGLLSLFTEGNFDIKSIFTNYTDTNIVNNIKQKTLELEESKESMDKLETILLERKKNISILPTILPISHKNIIISSPFQEGALYPRYAEFVVIAGLDIRVTADGVIESINFTKDLGFEVTISHKFAITTEYIGLATVNYSVGEKVKKGSILGKSKYSHFGYAIKVVSSYINPLVFTDLADLGIIPNE